VLAWATPSRRVDRAGRPRTIPRPFTKRPIVKKLEDPASRPSTLGLIIHRAGPCYV